MTVTDQPLRVDRETERRNLHAAATAALDLVALFRDRGMTTAERAAADRMDAALDGLLALRGL